MPTQNRGKAAKMRPILVKMRRLLVDRRLSIGRRRTRRPATAELPRHQHVWSGAVGRIRRQSAARTPAKALGRNEAQALGRMPVFRRHLRRPQGLRASPLWGIDARAVSCHKGLSIDRDADHDERSVSLIMKILARATAVPPPYYNQENIDAKND